MLPEPYEALLQTDDLFGTLPPSERGQMAVSTHPVLSCVYGTNADLFKEALRLHVKEGARIADVTYGKGVFWRKVPEGLYHLVPSDLLDGIDFTRLPYEADSFDALVFDPPYMHGGATIKASINDRYHNQNTSHESVVALYLGGILEARRVLKKGGVLLLKCQNEVESGRQRMTYQELLTILPLIGFRILDEFVLHSSAIPAMRESYQYHARKNHRIPFRKPRAFMPGRNERLAAASDTLLLTLASIHGTVVL